MPSYLLQEDGFRIALEDGSGFILLELDDAAQLIQRVILGAEPDGDDDWWVSYQG